MRKYMSFLGCGRRWTLVLWATAGLLYASSTAVAAEPAAVPAEADNWLQTEGIENVEATLRGDEPALYGFDSANAITIGGAYPTYVFTPDFIAGTVPAQGTRLEQTNEYIAAVYQEGVPTNVIGVYEPQPEIFEFSTFGYGDDLAKSLDRLDRNTQLVYEFPRNAWYGVTSGRIRPLNDSARPLLDGETGLVDFQTAIVKRYAADLRRPAGTSLVGGSSTVSPDADMRGTGLPRPWLVVGATLLMLAVGLSAMRWRKAAASRYHPRHL